MKWDSRLYLPFQRTRSHLMLRRYRSSCTDSLDSTAEWAVCQQRVRVASAHIFSSAAHHTNLCSLKNVLSSSLRRTAERPCSNYLKAAYERREECLVISCPRPQLFVQALFDYDPEEDPAVPCKEAAVAFKRGDILQVVSTEDDTWWQARRLGSSDARAGLIPSQQLHER